MSSRIGQGWGIVITSASLPFLFINKEKKKKNQLGQPATIYYNMCISKEE